MPALLRRIHQKIAWEKKETMGPFFIGKSGLAVFLLALGGVALWLRKASQSWSTDDALPVGASDRVFNKRRQIFKLLSIDLPALTRGRMCALHLMTDKLITVLPTCSANEVRNLFPHQFIRHVLVCTAAGKLVGIISNRDLANSSAKTAKELMTPRPITIEPDCLIEIAVTRMMENHISCLPVVKDEEVCGVLTSADLMIALQCALSVFEQVASEFATPRDSAEVFAS